LSDISLQTIDNYAFQQDLLTWYRLNKRDLPWRRTNDPYKIWVSEIMLQQTRVDTVIPYYEHFMTLYPTVFDLAQADPQAVLKAWEGLGYYSRVKNLQHAVQEVVSTYGGVVPSNPKELGSLKGIGPYTRGAVLSIAFNQPEPAVDGNVMRVLSRVLKIEENIAQPKVKRLFEAHVRELISQEDPSSFNQGIMELGALICTPKAPECTICPVQQHCRAYDEGIAEQLPIKSKAKKQKTIPYVALLIKNKQNEYVIEKRPNKGLLADLWQFPMVPINEIGMDHIENWVYGEYGLTISLQGKQGKLKHVFSHIIWQLEIYHAITDETSPEEEPFRFVAEADLSAYPFPVSHLNMMKYLSAET